MTSRATARSPTGTAASTTPRSRCPRSSSSVGTITSSARRSRWRTGLSPRTSACSPAAATWRSWNNRRSSSARSGSSSATSRAANRRTGSDRGKPARGHRVPVGTPCPPTPLTATLVGRPPGSGVRLWVERGMRPHAQMMIDHPSVRDVPVTVDSVPLLLDESSLKFLLDAEVRYHSDPARAGFEVVGPFLPSATAPAPPAKSAALAPSTAASAPGSSPGSARPEIEQKVQDALRNIYDPEIPMNIIDLGLIYGMDWDAS